MLGLFLFEGCYVFLSTMVFCFCFFWTGHGLL